MRNSKPQRILQLQQLASGLATFETCGPVHHQSTQRKANRAWLYLQPFLTPSQINRIQIAWDHALELGEGRAEFDKTMSAIRTELKLWGCLPYERD